MNGKPPLRRGLRERPEGNDGVFPVQVSPQFGNVILGHEPGGHRCVLYQPSARIDDIERADAIICRRHLKDAAWGCWIERLARFRRVARLEPQMTVLLSEIIREYLPELVSRLRARPSPSQNGVDRLLRNPTRARELLLRTHPRADEAVYFEGQGIGTERHAGLRSMFGIVNLGFYQEVGK